MKPQARKLILELLRATDGHLLSARDAITASALFGISANNARVALARLAADGLIEAAERGSYALSARAHELADDVATWRSAEQRVREWKGGYIAAYCGALGRSDRAVLRSRKRALDMLGFREVERGLFVRPDNIERDLNAVRARLYALGLEREASVFAVSDFDAVREASVRKLWDGRALNSNYRKQRLLLEQWLAGCARLKPEVAARDAFLVGGRAIRHVVYDPFLPEPLVDVQARRAFVETVRHFDQVGRQIWRRFYDTQNGSVLPRLVPAPQAAAVS